MSILRLLRIVLPLSLAAAAQTFAAQEATAVTGEQLAQEGFHGQRVTVTASVHDVAVVDGKVRLLLRSKYLAITAWLPFESDPMFELLDALVTVTGTAQTGTSPDENARGRVLLDARADLHVLTPGSADIFSRPLRTLAQLREPLSLQGERVRVIGTVTCASPANWFYFQDATGTSRAGLDLATLVKSPQRRFVQPNPNPQPGDVVELVGMRYNRPAEIAPMMPWLYASEWRIIGKKPVPPFEKVSAATVMTHDFDGRPVSLRGELTEIAVQPDFANFINHTVTVDDDGTRFTALLQRETAVALPVHVGDYVQTDGVVYAKHTPEGKTTSFRVSLNGLADLRLAPREVHVDLVRWLFGGGALALVSLAWIFALRMQVKKQTARLREANLALERFKAIVDTTSDFVGMATLDRKTVFINRAGRNLLGIGEDEDVTGILLEELYTAETMQRFQSEFVPAVMTHGVWQGEADKRHRDGHEIRVSMVGSLVRADDGTPRYLCCVSRDLSARVTMEQQLRDTNLALERFKAVAECTSDFVGMNTLDLKPLYLNPAGRAMLGIAPDEDVTTLSFDSLYTPKAMETLHREAFPSAMAHGVWQGEVEMIHHDGHLIPVSLVGIIVKAADGTPLHMGGIARDLSERVAMEKQLRTALDTERELNALKSTFVNTVSHEFRTPLGNILFAASMLRRYDARFGAVERMEQVAAIENAAACMNDLVEQSLSLGRAEAAQPDLKSLDAAALCCRIVDEAMSSSSRRSPVTFECGENADAPAFSDETMLRAILVNLLGNAVKYSPAGSSAVLRLTRDGGSAIFTVRDHGPGLGDGDMPKIFTPFHRGAHTDGIPGTGLGLAIVKRCAEALGGTVAARNADDGGAEFTVTLPHFFPAK